MKARLIAARALVSVEQGNGYSNLVLRETMPRDTSPADASFCSAIFYGTLMRAVTLDSILGKCVSRPLDKLDCEIRAVLRSGLYQALYMDSIRPETAVDESVKLSRELGKGSASGFVNAVLRNCLKLDLTYIELDRALKYSINDSILDLLDEQYPDRKDEILEAWLASPYRQIRVNTLKTTVGEVMETLTAAGVNCERLPLAGSLKIDRLGDACRTSLFKSGEMRVQGLWSQYACHALEAKAGETVFDMCAAPGGKALTIAQLMENRGTLRAFDANLNRLRLLDGFLEREGVEIISREQNDATIFNPALGMADRVLCDVPCSNLGVIATKPEIRLRDVSNVDELVALQTKILSESSRYVKAGGRLVYSTCTIDRRENERVAEAFAAEHPEFRVIVPQALAEITQKGEKFTNILPSIQNSFGFFIATFERI